VVSVDDGPIRPLLETVTRHCFDDEGVDYMEADISAHAPRMQRTLVELGFLPAAYVPAMVFHEVERLDIIRMVRLLKLEDLGPLSLTPLVQEMADVVMGGFYTRSVTPRIAEVVTDIPLFQGLNQEQVERLASTCTVQEFNAGEVMFRESDPADRMFIVLDGQITVGVGSPPVQVGKVKKGETLGEFSLLSAKPRTASAQTTSKVETAVLSYHDLADLVRRRPDIGVIIYRSLGIGLGEKLLRSDQTLREQALTESEFLRLSQPAPSVEQ